MSGTRARAHSSVCARSHTIRHQIFSLVFFAYFKRRALNSKFFRFLHEEEAHRENLTHQVRARVQHQVAKMKKKKTSTRAAKCRSAIRCDANRPDGCTRGREATTTTKKRSVRQHIQTSQATRQRARKKRRKIYLVKKRVENFGRLVALLKTAAAAVAVAAAAARFVVLFFFFIRRSSASNVRAFLNERQTSVAGPQMRAAFPSSGDANQQTHRKKKLLSRARVNVLL